MKKALLICFILSSLCFFKSVKSSKRIKRELKFPKGASFTVSKLNKFCFFLFDARKVKILIKFSVSNGVDEQFS